MKHKKRVFVMERMWFNNLTTKEVVWLGALGSHGVVDSWIPLAGVSQVGALNSEDGDISGSFCFLNRLSNNPALFGLGLTTLPITCVANSWIFGIL